MYVANRKSAVLVQFDDGHKFAVYCSLFSVGHGANGSETDPARYGVKKRVPLHG